MGKLRRQLREDHAEAAISIWPEALFGVELLLLHAAPVFYGFGVPHGDRSGVVLIPCFLGTDPQMTHLHLWLRRIGYRSYFSRIGVNAGCPNLLVRERLTPTIDKALAATGRKVHLIGHSLGGVIARSIAANRPADIASVITLASHFAEPWLIEAFCVPPSPSGRRPSHSTEFGSYPTVTRHAALANLSIRCATRCPLRSREPQSTRAKTESWIGAIAGLETARVTSKFEVHTLDSFITLPFTPSLPIASSR